MYKYDYEEFRTDVHALARQCNTFEPDTIIGIARGGLMLSQALGYALDIRNVQSVRVESYDNAHKRDTLNLHVNCDFSHSKKVLVVDDIVDSGDTLKHVLEYCHSHYPNIVFKSAALFYKPTAVIQSDFKLKEATGWIDFFWEKDFLVYA